MGQLRNDYRQLHLLTANVEGEFIPNKHTKMNTAQQNRIAAKKRSKLKHKR